MPVKSDYYTRSQAYKDAHRHGSINHPQDISFLDDWYVESDDAPNRKLRKPKQRSRRAAPGKKFESNPVDLEDLVRKATNFATALGFYIVVLSLLRNPFLLAFLISAPIISHAMGSSHSPNFLATYLLTARTALQDPEPEALERRQSVGVIPTTLVLLPPAGHNPRWLFDYRTYLPAALDAEDPYKDIDPIHQNRRTLEESLADTLPRIYQSMRALIGFLWDVVKFQMKGCLLLMALKLVVAYFRGNVAQLHWLPRVPTSLREIKYEIQDLATINWEYPANAYVLHICSVWWGWIYGFSRFLLWEGTKAVVKLLWSNATKGAKSLLRWFEVWG